MTVVRKPFALAALTLLLAALVALATGSASTAGAAGGGLPGEGFLPNDRVWELVSPPDKEGVDVIGDASRTRSAVDGSAVGFGALGGFGDVESVPVSTYYIARRSGDVDPGSNGWATHAVSPRQDSLNLPLILGQNNPKYVGEFSADLDRGVFESWSPLDEDDPYVANAVNVHLASGLLTPGGLSFDLLSPCPLCEATDTPLEPLPLNVTARDMATRLAWATEDLGHVLLASLRRLTADTPPLAGACNPADMGDDCRRHLYENDHGTLRFVGYVPPSASDLTCGDGGPVCVAADNSIPGQRGGENSSMPAPSSVSDGSDGHSRIFFTHLTDAGDQTSSEVGGSAAGDINVASSGRLFMRVDGTSTVRINASERTDCAGDPTCGGDGIPDPAPAASGPARFWDASKDGTRVFFTSKAALTDAIGGSEQLYMYDATKPPDAPDNLTLLSRDAEPIDVAGFGAVEGTVGVSDAGDRVYFLTDEQLVAGEPPLMQGFGLYLWHDGDTRFVGRVSKGRATGLAELTVKDPLRFQSGVTPDGRRLVFTAFDGSGLTGADHGDASGACAQNLDLNGGCREVYLYSADEDELVCVSCKPDGSRATGPAIVRNEVGEGGAGASHQHLSRVVSGDGRYVFFSTMEKLVAADVNGPCVREGSSVETVVGDCVDAYVYDRVSGQASLLSSGKSGAGSYFLEASPDGRDAFFITRERLSEWDVDDSYDLYDARVGGGFPEPDPVEAPCVDDMGCKGAADGPPAGLGLAGPTGGDGNAVVGERARLSVAGLSRRTRARAARSGVLAVRVRSSRAGVVRVKATARLAGRQRTVGSGRARARRAGTVTVRVSLDRRARTRLRAGRPLSLRLGVSMARARTQLVSVVLERSGR